jgi:NAD-dependent dihydropyrimidine dehydrogenase PreA subunit
MKESTRRVFRLHGWRVDRAIHNYLYFVFYDLYVKGALYLTQVIVTLFGRFPATRHLARFIFDRYHAKVLSWGDLTKILQLEEAVDLGPDTTGRIIPFRYANRIVLREPTHLAVMDCPCKLELDDPCQPVASCIAVGRPLVDFWLEHCEKYHVRRITQEEALDIIERHRQNGHITQAFFKVATGGSMGVICSCCPRCCVSMRATALVRKIKGAEGISQYAPSGYKVAHDPGSCRACGSCAETCHFGAVEFREGRRLYHPEKCYGCELCVERCPAKALSLFLPEGGLLPLDLELAGRMLTGGRS